MRSRGYSLIELMLVIAVMMTVAFLSLTRGGAMFKEEGVRGAAIEAGMLRDTVVFGYAMKASYSGLTSATALSEGLVPQSMRGNGTITHTTTKILFDVSNETDPIPGSRAPEFAIFARNVGLADCVIFSSKVAGMFDRVLVNGVQVKGSGNSGLDAGALSGTCTASGNTVKMVHGRLTPWITCRSLGTQFEEDACPSGYNGKVVYKKDYSCAAGGGFEPGSFSPRVEVSRNCCRALGPESDVRSDCPYPQIGTRTWGRTYSCGGNGGNEPGAWSVWSVTAQDCRMPPYFVADVTINTNTLNFNMRNAARALGWDGVQAVHINVTVAPGVYVGSSSAGSPSFDTSSGYPSGSVLTLVNNGNIYGQGGTGGSGKLKHDASSDAVSGPDGGGGGGTGLVAGYPIRIRNLGTIAGGGQGGAGGWASRYNSSPNGAGGGGGGQGYPGGYGGRGGGWPGWPGVSQGRSGSPSGPGAGGAGASWTECWGDEYPTCAPNSSNAGGSGYGLGIGSYSVGGIGNITWDVRGTLIGSTY